MYSLYQKAQQMLGLNGGEYWIGMFLSRENKLNIDKTKNTQKGEMEPSRRLELRTPSLP